jgi:hypothetical protein
MCICHIQIELSEITLQNLLPNLSYFTVEYKTRTGPFKGGLKFIVEETSQSNMIIMRMEIKENEKN